jgi:membrane protein DedA with SNARE-associated domain
MFGSFLIDLFNSLSSIINDVGYLGIFIGMIIESTIFPLPSEIMLIPAGALVARGEMSFLIVLLVAVGGTILGALINFLFAMFFGREIVNMLVKKYGRFLFITAARLKKADDFFNNHGEITTFIGRLIPVARHIISLPAGFSRMNILRFVIYTALGAAVWSAFLIYLGYVFGNRLEWINSQLGWLYIPIMVIVLVILVIYLLIQKKKSKKKK